MSTNCAKLIPCDYQFIPENESADQAVRFLKQNIKADDITYDIFENPEFIDCGENLTEISCPYCKAEIDFDRWGEMMNECSSSDFSNLEISLPCCGKKSSLNDLIYDFPCGFARFEIDISEPEATLDDAEIHEVEKLFRQKFKLIEARY